MFSEKSLKILITYVLIVAPVLMICIIILSTKCVSVTWNGIAVDSAGHLYLGTNAKVQVYSGEELINTFYTSGNGSSRFEVQDDNTIYLCVGNKKYTLDAEGGIIDIKEHVQLQEQESIQEMQNRFEANDGSVYTIKSKFGRLFVVCNENKTVFKMPMADYIVKLVLLSCSISIFVVVLWVIVRSKRNN